MFEQLRLNKHAIVILMAGIIMLSMASDGRCDQNIDDNHKNHHGLEGDRTTDFCGLYKIPEVARKFVATQNAINHTNWEVIDPDHRACFGGCLVPLKAKWMPHKWAEKDSSPGVMVYCTKASTNPKNKYWDEILDVSPPLGSFELLFNIREAAVALLEQTHSKQTADFSSTDVFVGKCLVPLEAALIKKKNAISADHINVTCKKPLQTFFFKGDSWTLPIPLSGVNWREKWASVSIKGNSVTIEGQEVEVGIGMVGRASLANLHLSSDAQHLKTELDADAERKAGEAASKPNSAQQYSAQMRFIDDEGNGESNLPITVVLQTGKFIRSYTDGDGMTDRYFTDDEQIIEIFIGHFSED